MEKLFFSFLIVATLLYASYWDWKQRIIPNRVPGIIIMVGLVQIIGGGSIEMLIAHMLSGLLMAAVLWILNLVHPNGMGGGDYKLLIALCFVYGIYGVLPLLVLSAVVSIGHCILLRVKSVPFAVDISMAYVSLLLITFLSYVYKV